MSKKMQIGRIVSGAAPQQQQRMNKVTINEQFDRFRLGKNIFQIQQLANKHKLPTSP
jgi:hypothetical protein